MIDTIRQVRFPGREWLLRLLHKAPRYQGRSDKGGVRQADERAMIEKARNDGMAAAAVRPTMFNR